MLRFRFKNLAIEVFNDLTYSSQGADNKFAYPKQYFSDSGQEFPTSRHGIKIADDQEATSCIIIGAGGATGVSKNSALVDDDKLLICCGDTLFCLSLPTLDLLWKTKADTVTCFQVFKLNNDYLVHGELDISRVDREGKIKWQFGGVDIFVNTEGKDEILLNSDHIILTDFSGADYKIDFEGKLV